MKATLCWRHWRAAYNMGCGFLEEISGMIHDLSDTVPCDWCALEALPPAVAA